MNNFKKMMSPASLVGLLTITITGCTTHYGSVVPNSAFIYPNSNIKPLGPVTASKSKTWFFLMPSLKFDDVKAVYDQAASQAPGANVLIDYKEDTAVTSIMFINTVSYSIDGTAAKMDIGKKDIGQ